MILENLPTGKIFETLFISFFLCMLLVPLSIKFARRTKLMDIPNSQPHKMHKYPVPLSGGIAFAATMILTTAYLNTMLSPQLLKLLLSALVIFGFALWDDYRPLPPYIKLLGQLIAVGIMITFSTRVQIMQSIGPVFSLSKGWIEALDLLITVFWMVFITNAYNLVDSMDGLMIGLASLALTFFIMASIDNGQWPLALLCAAMLGACIVLNFFNSSPAFLFLGDSGAQTIGYLLAAIAILYDPPDKVQGSTWFMPILLLGVPIFDTVLVIFSRWRRNLHFYSSGIDHTYHRLVRRGFSSVQAVQLMHLVAIALEIFAFFTISQKPLTANLFFFLIVIAGILCIAILESDSPWKINDIKDKTE